MKKLARKAAETAEIARNTLADTLQGIPKPTSDRLIEQVGGHYSDSPLLRF